MLLEEKVASCCILIQSDRNPMPFVNALMCRASLIHVSARMALLNRRAKGISQAVHAQALHYSRARLHAGDPSVHMGVRRHVEELRSLVKLFAAQNPRHHRHVSNGVLVAAQELLVSEVQVQHVELAFGFHRETVNGVFNLHRRVLVEVAKPTTNVWG